jgi:hypothetical protein
VLWRETRLRLSYKLDGKNITPKFIGRKKYAKLVLITALALAEAFVKTVKFLLQNISQLTTGGIASAIRRKKRRTAPRQPETSSL